MECLQDGMQEVMLLLNFALYKDDKKFRQERLGKIWVCWFLRFAWVFVYFKKRKVRNEFD